MASSTLDSPDRSRLLVLRDILTPLQHELSLPHLVCLVAIAAEPGMSVTDLAARTGIPQASASRYVAVLLGRYQSLEGRPPTPLIEQEISRENPRSRALFLNTQGQQILTTILRAFDDDSFSDSRKVS